jgi:hypothetical protein
VDEALTYALSAPFITLAVALLRRALPWIEGVSVPPMVVSLSFAWGFVLISTGRFTGDTAEFIVAGVTVAAAAMGMHGAVTTYYTRSDRPPLPGEPR